MTKYSALLALLGALVFARGASAQQEEIQRPKSDSYSFDSDEQPPTIGGNGRSVDKGESLDEKKPGFPWISLPKPKLPTLPKPSLPKLSLPSWATTQTTTTKSVPRSRKAQEPSTWEKVSSGTKSVLTKTKDTLTFWKTDDEPSTTRPKAPAARTARSTSTKSKPEKKSFFSSWLKPEPEYKKVETVDDYLSQPRVKF